MSDEHTMWDEGSTPLAAEYVLGVLSAQERRDFERRLTREPALASEVEFWEQKLGVLTSEVKAASIRAHDCGGGSTGLTSDVRTPSFCSQYSTSLASAGSRVSRRSPRNMCSAS